MLTGAASIGIAVGVYGVSFGVLAVAAGLSPAQACVMSMLVFTGASQFAFVGVLGAGGGALAAMGPAVMLAVRNAAYGLSLAPILPGRLRDRALSAQLVIDESTAMARAQDNPGAARRAFLALLAPQLRRPGAPVAAVAGAMVAVAALPFAPAGVPVIAALAGVVPGVLVARGVRG